MATASAVGAPISEGGGPTFSNKGTNSSRRTWTRVFRVKQLLSPLKAPQNEPAIKHVRPPRNTSTGRIVVSEQPTESEPSTDTRIQSRATVPIASNVSSLAPANTYTLPELPHSESIEASIVPAHESLDCQESEKHDIEEREGDLEKDRGLSYGSRINIEPRSRTREPVEYNRALSPRASSHILPEPSCSQSNRDLVVHQEQTSNVQQSDKIDVEERELDQEEKREVSNHKLESQTQRLPASVSLPRSNELTPVHTTESPGIDGPQPHPRSKVTALGSRNPWRNIILEAAEPSQSELLEQLGPNGDGHELQCKGTGETVENGEMAYNREQNPNVVDRNEGILEPIYSTRTASTPRSSVDPSSLASTKPSSVPDSHVGHAATTEQYVEVTFCEQNVERIGRNCFMDRRAVLPDVVAQEWNQNIRPRFDMDLHKIIASISAGNQYILSSTEFGMAGLRDGGTLCLEPTIIVTCGTKNCTKHVRKALEKLRLHYLESFNRPIKVRYQAPPLYWAALTLDVDALSTSDAGYENYQIYESESTVLSHTYCGRAIKVSAYRRPGHNDQGTNWTCLEATLGGLIAVDGKWYAMTTAHELRKGFDRQHEDRNYENENDNERTSSCSSENESESGTSARLPRSPYSPSLLGRERLWSNGTKDPTILSFGSLVTYYKNFRQRHATGLIQASSMADWVLFPVDTSRFLPNIHAGVEFRSIIPEGNIVAGSVDIICRESITTGYLTQTYASMHTRDGIMDVRQIVLDSPLPLAVSGAWVVRGSEVCGYIIAVTRRGLSCFMMPMQRAFKEIKVVLGGSVSLEPPKNTKLMLSSKNDNLAALGSSAAGKIRDTASTSIAMEQILLDDQDGDDTLQNQSSACRDKATKAENVEDERTDDQILEITGQWTTQTDSTEPAVKPKEDDQVADIRDSTTRPNLDASEAKAVMDGIQVVPPPPKRKKLRPSMVPVSFNISCCLPRLSRVEVDDFGMPIPTPAPEMIQRPTVRSPYVIPSPPAVRSPSPLHIPEIVPVPPVHVNPTQPMELSTQLPARSRSPPLRHQHDSRRSRIPPERSSSSHHRNTNAQSERPLYITSRSGDRIRRDDRTWNRSRHREVWY